MDAISQLNRNKRYNDPGVFCEDALILSIQYMNELDFLYEVKGLSEFSSPPTLRSWVSENKERFMSKLEETGAILFSDLPVKDAKEFDHFVSMFNLKAFTYKQSLSNAVRINKTDKVLQPTRHRKRSKSFCTTN